MASIGEAAARGLETGFMMGGRIVSARQEAEDRQRRQRLEDEDRAQQRDDRTVQRRRQADADARAARDQELRGVDSDIAFLQSEGSALASVHGGFDKVPEDIRTEYVGRVRETRGRRAKLRETYYGPTVQDQRRAASETWARIQAGQLQPDQLSGDDLVRTLTAQTGRPLTDFLGGRDGSPSVVKQAILDVEAGLQAGHRDLLLRGANVLLQRELSTGVGTEGRDGSEIIKKTLVELVPHPQDANRVIPIVDVTVRREDGATGTYRAPVTEDRGVWAGNPQAVPRGLSVQELMDRLGQYGAMESWLNDPAMRRRIESASPEAKASADEFLQALASVGVAAPKTDWRSVAPGHDLVGLDMRGREVARVKGPEAAPRATGLAGTVNAINGMLDRGEIDEATADRLRKAAAQRQATGTKTAGGTDTGSGAGTGTGGGAGSQLTGEAFLKTLSTGDRALVLAIAEGRAKAPELTTKDGRRLNALVQQYDPTFDGNKGGFKGEDTLRDEFVKASGDFLKIRNAYGLVQAAAKDPSAGGDMALIFSFMRILDPNSVVREGEFATAQNAAGVPDRVVNLYNRLIKGERLNPTQRADFVNQAKKIYEEQQGQHQVLESTYRDLAKRSKLNPDNVVIPLGREPGRPAGQGPVSLPPAARARLKEGQVTTFGNGQRWTLQGGHPVQVQQ